MSSARSTVWTARSTPAQYPRGAASRTRLGVAGGAFSAAVVTPRGYRGPIVDRSDLVRVCPEGLAAGAADVARVEDAPLLDEAGHVAAPQDAAAQGHRARVLPEVLGRVEGKGPVRPDRHRREREARTEVGLLDAVIEDLSRLEASYLGRTQLEGDPHLR